MSSPTAPKLSEIQQKLSQVHLSLATLCKTLAITSGLVIFTVYVFFHRPYTYNHPSNLLLATPSGPQLPAAVDPTNITHLVFGLVGSMNTWPQKRHYVESWWRPNVTRGYIFLDRPPAEPWPPSSPPFRVSDDISNWTVYSKFVRPDHMRIVRTVLETFREGEEGVRWYVMADDDTVLFLDNLVEVLGGYDHNKYMYIGASSECIKSDSDLSFEMAFGGAGYALSYPLVEILVTKIDGCLERYPYSWVSDYLIYKCIEDLGVALTHHKGFHQIDLHNDISGLLSAHPQTPLLSLHHIDVVDPIFPSKNRSKSIAHIMRAARADSSRLLQQTICYNRATTWSVSVSWGYSAYIYEQIHPRSVLHRPLETFRPWVTEAQPPLYVFNPRWPSDDPCAAPHVYFFDSAERKVENETVVTTYVRLGPRGLGVCVNNSADYVSKVVVHSPITPLNKDGRTECCDVQHAEDANTTQVRIRGCFKDEIIA